MSVDSLREQLKQRGYLSHGIERWFALDPWRSRTFWAELLVVCAKAAVLIGAFGLLPMVAIVLFRNHPLGAWETFAAALCYGVTLFAVGFILLAIVALVLKLRPAVAIDTPRALLGISFAASALLSAGLVVWWYGFENPPALPELVTGLVLIVLFFLIGTIGVSAALLSFSIHELQRVPAIHQRSRGVPMTIAAAILTALLFIPAYATQGRRDAESPPVQVVTLPTSRSVALIAVDGLTWELVHARADVVRGFTALQAIPPVRGGSTAERWASVGTGVPPRLHGVHAVEGIRFRGGSHVLQTLSNTEPVLRSVAPAIGLARREPLPPTVRRRDFVWEIFAARGIPSVAVNWWTAADLRAGALESVGQAAIFTAAHGDPLQVDSGATRQLLRRIEQSRPRFATVYLPALDIILNRIESDRSTELAESVRALDQIGFAVEQLRARGFDIIVIGLPGERQSGSGVLASTIPPRRAAGSAFDLAPTLCALMGFPASSEMTGRALVSTELPRIATYGRRETGTGPMKVNEEYYRNLKSLGYIK